MARAQATLVYTARMAQDLPPIVLVDDLAEDRYLFERAYEMSDVDNPILSFDSGESIQEHLTRVEIGEEAAPCVVLLDLNMPRLSGFNVLEWLATRPLLGHVPVLVFTSSDQPSDIVSAYDMGATGYLRKPLVFTELQRLVASVGEYWGSYNLQRPAAGDQ